MPDLLPDVIDLEQELSGEDDISHGYVICNVCRPILTKGSLLQTVCGRLLRFREASSKISCPECKAIRSTNPDPNYLPCCLCGHRW